MKNDKLLAQKRIDDGPRSQPNGHDAASFKGRGSTAAGNDNWPDAVAMAAHRNAAARARAGKLGEIAGSAVRHLRAWWERRVAVAALERLGDRALADFGWSRGDVHRLRSGALSVGQFNAEREALQARWNRVGASRPSRTRPLGIKPEAAANQPAYDHAA